MAKTIISKVKVEVFVLFILSFIFVLTACGPRNDMKTINPIGSGEGSNHGEPNQSNDNNIEKLSQQVEEVLSQNQEIQSAQGPIANMSQNEAEDKKTKDLAQKIRSIKILGSLDNNDLQLIVEYAFNGSAFQITFSEASKKDDGLVLFKKSLAQMFVNDSALILSNDKTTVFPMDAEVLVSSNRDLFKVSLYELSTDKKRDTIATLNVLVQRSNSNLIRTEKSNKTLSPFDSFALTNDGSLNMVSYMAQAIIIDANKKVITIDSKVNNIIIEGTLEDSHGKAISKFELRSSLPKALQENQLQLRVSKNLQDSFKERFYSIRLANEKASVLESLENFSRNQFILVESKKGSLEINEFILNLSIADSNPKYIIQKAPGTEAIEASKNQANHRRAK